MKSRVLPTLPVVLCFLLSGCFTNDAVPVSPCYPQVYRQVIGTSRVEEYYTFNQFNKLETVSNETRNGNTRTNLYLDLEYDKKGILSAVRYADGSAYLYTTNAAGKITSINFNSSSGVTTQKQEFTYNASGQVTKRQYHTLSSGVLTKSTSYTYEYPNTTTNNYSKRSLFNSNDVLQSYITYTYDTKPNTSTLLSIFPSVVTTNNVLSQVNSNATGTSQVTWTWSYTYSAKGFPLSYKATNGLGSEETYSYEYMNCIK